MARFLSARRRAVGIVFLSLALGGIATLMLSRCGLKKTSPVTPGVISIDPARGPSTGSTLVTVNGSNFFNGATVSIGGNACTVQAISPPSRLTCTTVPHVPATSDVDVTNSGGSPGILALAYSYLISAWGFTVGNAGNGLNKSSSQPASTPALAEFNGKLYAAWSESNGTITQIRVAVYNNNDNDPAWTFVDGGGTNGINHVATNAAVQPMLAVANNLLYATWAELNGTYRVIRVAVFNGNDSAPSWSFAVDGNGATGINKGAFDAISPRLQEFNGKLYASWSEADGASAAVEIRVAVYTPPSTWTFIDGNNPAAGLNRNAAAGAGRSWLEVFNSKLYATWLEGATLQVRAAVYNGNDTAPTWAFVDGNNIATGINHNTSMAAGYSSLITVGNKLYAVWNETLGTVLQIRAAVYSGVDSAPTWTFVDGNGANGLNHDPTKAASTPRPGVLGSTLYLIWTELNGTMNNVRVAAYNGNDSLPAWTSSDGGGTAGINRNPALDAQLPYLTLFNNKLYSTWSEMNGSGVSQIWVAVGQ